MNGIDYNLIVIIVLLTVTILFIQLLLETRKKPREPKTVTRTLLKCTSCGETIETNYEPGDFIGLIKGQCKKCNSPLRVTAIYDVEIPEK